MRRLAPEETNEFCFHRGKGSLANGDYERYESSPPAFFLKEPPGDDADRPLEQGRRPFPVRAHRLKRGEQDACHHRDGLGTARYESHGQTNGQDYDR